MSEPKRSQAFNLGRPPAVARREQLPPPTSSPSLTVYKSRKNPLKPVELPLEAFARGAHIVQSVDLEDSTPKFWLRVRDNHVSIMRRPIENEHSVVDLELPQDICGVGVSV